MIIAPLEVNANGRGFRLRAAAEADRPLVLQGDGGYSRKSERGQASYYYSQPYFKATGSLTIDDKPVEVTGQAWMDREWSSQPLASDQTGWDWFSLHLDSGEKLMLFRLRQTDGENYFSGNWIARDGKSAPDAAGGHQDDAERLHRGRARKIADGVAHRNCPRRRSRSRPCR